eukprot:sb/3470646/
MDELLWGIWGIVGWHGVDRLRMMINGVDNPEWRPMNWKCELQALLKPHFSSIFFGFFIKYLIPTILWTLFFTTFRDDVTSKYSNYPIAYQVVGYLIFATMLLLVVSVAIFPSTHVKTRCFVVDGFGVYAFFRTQINLFKVVLKSLNILLFLIIMRLINPWPLQSQSDPELPEADKIDYDNESEIYGEGTVKVNPMVSTAI